MAHHLTDGTLFWPRVRRYAVPPAMIKTATARRETGDWAGACAAARVEVDLELGSAKRAYGTALVSRLRADLRHLAPDLLRWHMPRTAPDGLLRPALTIPLARYDTDGRALWLVVRTPPAWADAGQRMSLALWDGNLAGDALARRHPHPHPSRRFRLDLHRHLWDARRAGELADRATADDQHATRRWYAEAALLLDAEGLPAGPVEVRTGGRRRVVDTRESPPGGEGRGFAPDAGSAGGVGEFVACVGSAGCAGGFAAYVGSAGCVGEFAACVGSAGRAGQFVACAEPPDGVSEFASYAELPAPVRQFTRPSRATPLPLLPDASTHPLPDLVLLRAGALDAGDLHPLVADALAPGRARPSEPASDQSHRFVDCRGERHRIGFVGGVLAPLDHAPEQLRREELLTALSGTPLPCLRVIDEAHRRPDCLTGVRERLEHGDTAGALAVVEELLGPDAVLRDGPLKDALAEAAERRVVYGLYRAGLSEDAPERRREQRTGRRNRPRRSGRRPRPKK
ncbi:hypothetical protein PV682_20560 [Streptomyces niveiscabiei]|uniref:hypothetical protein n=1 Tax=Streptomyces niveiscabiei TaxID=164115 RepID=UPI0029AA4F44|nr:hypothetical protein [Streptomyces niveiscabiei]MDX3383837.1 hypothetical protein [Streptomyces niveiscabiei]